MLCIDEQPPCIYTDEEENKTLALGIFYANNNTSPLVLWAYAMVYSPSGTLEEYWKEYEINRKLVIIRLFELADEHKIS